MRAHAYIYILHGWLQIRLKLGDGVDFGLAITNCVLRVVKRMKRSVISDQHYLLLCIIHVYLASNLVSYQNTHQSIDAGLDAGCSGYRLLPLSKPPIS